MWPLSGRIQVERARRVAGPMALKAILTLLVAMLIFSGGPGAAQLELVGTFGGGAPARMQVQGDLAYCAASGGFLIVDVSDPTAPAHVSFLPMAYTLQVFVDGERAYATRWSQELVVLDVSDPASPFEMGSRFGDEIHDIYAAGDYAYLGCGNGLFLIYDVSDPSRIWEVGRMQYPDLPTGIYIQGDYAYLAVGDYGLSIVNISDPSAPSEEGHYHACPASDVFVTDNLAHVAARDSGVVVLDVADPSAPGRLGGLAGFGWSTRIKVVGTTAYVRTSRDLAILDVSEPALPVLTRKLQWVWGDASGDFLYVLGLGFGIKILDVSDPYAPVTIGTYLSFGDTRTVHATPDGLVYLKDGYEGFGVVDVSDPTAPVLIGHENVAWYGSDLQVVGSRAYLTGQTELEAVDIGDPWNPMSLGEVYISRSVQCSDVSGDHAYVGSYDGDVHVIDIADPASMFQAGSVAVQGAPSGICIAADKAYVSGVGPGLMVLDLSDPVSPSIMSTCDICGDPFGITGLDVSGYYTYAVDYWGWLVVVDISRLIYPTELGRVRVLHRAAAVDVEGCYAYVASGWRGLSVVDVSDPEAPFVVETYETAGTPADVSVAGGYIYLASRESALHIFKFTPSRFILSGTVTREEGRPADRVVIRLSGDAVDITATDNKGYYEFRGVEPGHYTLRPGRAGWSFSPETQDVTVVGEDIHDIDFSRKITTYVRLSAGGEGYAGGRPLRVEFAPASDGDVQVILFTLEGERVWETSERVRAGIPGVVEWYCKNSGGENVASGVYLVRVRGAGLDELKKAVVVW
jgi:hypothetical protein